MRGHSVKFSQVRIGKPLYIFKWLCANSNLVGNDNENYIVELMDQTGDNPKIKKEALFMKKTLSLGVMVLVMCFLISGPAFSQDKPDATIRLSQGQVAVGIGYSWGNGVLTFQGKEYPFKIRGLSVIDVGISKANANGEVFKLKNVKDFNGTYTTISGEATLAGGAGVITMKNQNGVTIKLSALTTGVNFKLALEGVKLTLTK